MTEVLSGPLLMLQISGLWVPKHCHSHVLRLLYKFFTILVQFFTCWFVLTGLIDLVLYPSHIMDSTDNLFTLLTLITDSGKCLNVIICRTSITRILDILEQDPCLPRDENEMAIQKKWDSVIWSNTMIYGVFLEISALLFTFGILFQDIPIGSLPFKAWLPFDYSHGIVYWLAYSQQLTTLIISTHICIAYDTLVRGFITQVSTKLHILKYRISILPKTLQLILDDDDDGDDKSESRKLNIERNLITDCVRYHHTIFKLAQIIIATFNVVVFLQYGLSSFILCLHIYTMAHVKPFSSQFIQMGPFLCSSLYQIYIFCQAGDEITLVSSSVSDTIYTMDWSNFNTSSVKSLVIIMARSLRPIIFTSGSLITLSRKSFMEVIKLSYSTYNILQNTTA